MSFMILNVLADPALFNNFKSDSNSHTFDSSHLTFEFSCAEEELYLIIHNIDGPMLRNERAQMTFSLLAQAPSIRIVASIDHINAPLSKYALFSSFFIVVGCG